MSVVGGFRTGRIVINCAEKMDAKLAEDACRDGGAENRLARRS